MSYTAKELIEMGFAPPSADTPTEVPRATPKITERHYEIIRRIAGGGDVFEGPNPVSTYSELESILQDIWANLAALASGESVLVPSAELKALRDVLEDRKDRGADSTLDTAMLSLAIRRLAGWLRGDTP